jgi:chaperonin GroEL
VTKIYESDRTLHDKLRNGINLLADNVASTLGPRGRNVIIATANGTPIITKDGVTVARAVSVDDPTENAGLQILKQAAIQTCNDAGDGTTTSTVLARDIFNKAQTYLAAGVSPTELKRGIDKAVEAIVPKLQASATPIKSEQDIAHIATISANGDKTIGTLIAKAVDLAGKDGAITIEEARSVETSLDVVEGFRFNSGYCATAFINDERRGVVRYENPLILVTDHKLETIEGFMPVLELAAREGKPLLVIADEIEGQLLAALIMNAMRGTLKCAAVKAPFYGEERRGVLSDLAASVGATLITREAGKKFKDMKLSDFGTAKTAEISRFQTCFVGGAGDPDEINLRTERLRSAIKETESLREAEHLQERVTRLSSGIAIIKVGGATEPEMVERKHRIEDALEAAKAAQESGVVAGGGVALLRAANGIDWETLFENDEQSFGGKIIRDAVKAPLRQMAENAGESPDLLLSMIEKEPEGRGFDFSTREMVDMLESGIIDPVKVTISALVNAASVSSTLLTINHAIVEEINKNN